MNLPSLDVYALWIGGGLILCALELFVPGIYLLWLGIAALITGAVSWAVPIGIEWQVVLFAALSVAAVFIGRRWSASNAIATDDPKLNDRVARLIGQPVEVVEAISNGRGRVRVGDGVWPASGPDAPVGARLTIRGADAGVLIVEA